MTQQYLCLHNPSELLLQPVELVLARVENRWRERRCRKARQARAASGTVLGVLSVKRFSVVVQFNIQPGVYSLTGPRLRKMALEKKKLSPRASLEKEWPRLPVCPGHRAATPLQNPIPHVLWGRIRAWSSPQAAVTGSEPLLDTHCWQQGAVQGS